MSLIELRDFKIALPGLPNDRLYSLKKEVLNSINKLNNSNSLMEAEIKKLSSKLNSTSDNQLDNDLSPLDDEDDDVKVIKDDIRLYKESISENKIVLKNNQKRIDYLHAEISNRNLQIE
ncbi:Tma17p ASCRUDRAFT_78091 [Ascoidea rubescens DSM 1968]|uniref:Uncharacterized protein n=1 Tax=Ascoidea rubescens DSM 1968 TaxID=1344418 RepID=A0A1D2V9N5_9ASCO|nr:hypothetical protein ASCRUDRAFT_78091 [Ascoidea rubescens DSM 1968]ODV58183.1 hypothetical protein ASCRUDRAFT_78091 [Ascoidea rubescens DSM 1968]